MAGSLGIDAPRAVAALRRRWWLVGAIVVVAVAAAIAVSRSQSNSYQASAIILFGQSSLASSQPGGAGTSSSSTSSPEDQATDLALASLDDVAVRVERQLPGVATVDQVRHAVSVQLQGNTHLASVTATADTPTKAALIANAFAQQIVVFRRQTAQAAIQQSIDAINNTIATKQSASSSGTGQSAAQNAGTIQSLQSQLSRLETLKAVQTGDGQVVQPATPPQNASSPHVARDAAIAAIIGLAIGIAVVLLLAQLDDRIHDEPELTVLMSAPVLARIPKISRTKRFGHASSVQQDRAFLDAFELLRLNLQLTQLQQGHVIVGVTSPAAGQGKTTVVASLARTIALSGVDVVAVDFDLRNPTLHASFQVDPQPTDGARRRSRDNDNRTHLHPTGYPHLRLFRATQLAAGPGTIAHQRVEFMLAQLRETADYVLVDTSPVSVGPDASAVVAAADGVILVVDLERVRRSDLLAARRQLEITRTTLLGIVVNRAGAAMTVHHPRDRAVSVAAGNAPPTFMS